MALLLYINGQQADLSAGQVIAQTKQVNDLNSLENRQAGYTNKFKLPKTANNLRIMNFLTVTGNDSAVPYQKNECSLYSDTGECFVYNGWAVITDGGDDYEAVIYDGIIDFYKKIEGQTLASLDLDKLTHEKNLTTVTSSWIGDDILKYKYIVADYNGMTMTTAPVTQPPAPAINIDYLVPSVKVAWLWEQIFNKNEFYCNGAIFDSPDFNNLWMTYPKGILSVENEELLFESSSYSFIGETTKSAPYVRKYFARYNNTATYNETMNNNGQIHLIAPQTGKYKLEISGRLNTRKQLYNLQNNPQDISIPAPCRIILGKNAINSTALTVIPLEVISMDTPSSTEFSRTLFITLNQGESICLGIGAVEEESYRMFTIASGSALKVKLTKIEPGVFDFNDAFSEFTVRDFLNEIVCRYGLTMYKDKYSKTLTFVTLQELFRESVVTDLSDKYVKKVSENYLYGSYAQQNWFRYNYHDKESSYNDGFLTVANTNLPEKRDVIKSKLYSPDQRTVTLLGRPTNVYRLWDKEVVEDPQPGEAALTYKPLDKRFYFLRPEVMPGAHLIASDLMQDWAAFANIPFETFTGLAFADIRAKYYSPLEDVLDKACIVTAELLLKDTDIINFDFKKRYYIEQLGANFIMNKIINYIPGKPVKCELIKVPDNMFEPFTVKINRVVISSYQVTIYYETTDTITGVIVEYDPGNDAWISLPFAGTSPVTFNLERGSYKLQLRAKGKLSNNVTINIPDVRTINSI